MGSVKDLIQTERATASKLGRGFFVFSDRYSVFDWGEMPDTIPGKGLSLALMSGHNFEYLENEGIDTHYRGLVEEGETKTVTELASPSRKMAIDLAYVPYPNFTDGEYHYPDLNDRSNYLIPLEVVFRNYVTKGSSLRRRCEPLELGFPFSSWPEERLELKEPLIEYSTKFEKKDRYLNTREALEISGLTEVEFQRLEQVALRVNSLLNTLAKERNFLHLDGKIECLYDRGNIAVADVVGTFDENRFFFEGIQISKELLRQWYKVRDAEWYEAVKEGQKKALSEGVKNWKKYVDREPRSLPSELVALIENVYKSGANSWIGKEFFDEPSLDQVVEEVKKWRQKIN